MSSIRRENRLLADIVEANGGTVTNKDNRCKLLQDWLDSLIDTLCNAYLFSSANSDYFEIEPFTGEFYFKLAASSETGLNADIVSGRVGEFVATTDYQDPQWVEYNAETEIIWTANGISYGELPHCDASLITFELRVDSYDARGFTKVIGSGIDQGSDSWLLQQHSSSGELRLLINNSTVGQSFFPILGEFTTISLDLSAVTLVSESVISIAKIFDDRVIIGAIKNLGIISKSGDDDRFYALNEPWSESHEFYDSIGGKTGTKYNDVESDYSGIKTVVDETFGGVIAKHSREYSPEPNSTAVTLISDGNQRQTFFGLGVSEINSSWSALSDSQKTTIFTDLYEGLDLKILRLWFEDNPDKFISGYIDSEIISRALASGVEELLLAPGTIPERYTTVVGEVHTLSDIDGYAEYLASFIKTIFDTYGILITTTGLINEPTANSIKEVLDESWVPLVISLRSSLDAKGLTTVKIVGTEPSGADSGHLIDVQSIANDPASLAAFGGIASHSYDMAANENWAQVAIDNDLPYWVTEAGADDISSGVNDYNYPVASSASARFLNDMNFMVTHWVWFIGAYVINAGEMQQRLIYWDADNLDNADWIGYHAQFYYLRQLSSAFTPGTILNHVTSSLDGDMTYTYVGSGNRTPLNAASGTRVDGKRVFGIVNNTVYLDDVYSFSPQTSATTYYVTVSVSGMEDSGEVRFTMQRSNQEPSTTTTEEIILINGQASFNIKPYELVTLIEVTEKATMPSDVAGIKNAVPASWFKMPCVPN